MIAKLKHWAHWRIYDWVENRGRAPWWVFKIWPDTHWCFPNVGTSRWPSMPKLVMGNRGDCICGMCGPKPWGRR